MKLPIENRQKFQIGDVCKIVEKGCYHAEFEFPKTPLESYLQDRVCIILYTYSQVYWGENFSDYSVYLLPRNEEEYSGSFAWVEENQLRFIRKPNNEEIEIVVNNDKRCCAWNNNLYKSIFKEKR